MCSNALCPSVCLPRAFDCYKNNDFGWRWSAIYAWVYFKICFFWVHHENLNEDWSTLSAGKCSPMNLISGNAKFMRIFAGVGRGGVKRQRGCRQQLFSVLSLAISSEPLEINPTLLRSDMESLVGFPPIPKHVTLNDLEWLFYVKFCFRVRRSRTFSVLSKNKYRPTLSAASMWLIGTLHCGA